MSELIWIFLVACAAVLAASVCIGIAARAPRTTVVLLLVLVMLGGSRLIFSEFALQVGPVSVYPNDILTVSLGLVVLARMVRGWGTIPLRGALLPATILVAVGLICWTAITGVELGTNAWRYWLLIVVLGWWAASRPDGWKPDDLRIFVWAGLAIAFLQVMSIAKDGLLTSTEGDLVEGFNTFDGRPLTSPAAMLMVAGLLVALTLPSMGKGSRVLLVIVLLPSIVISLQRSVWVAGLVVLLGVGLMRLSDRGVPQAVRVGAIGLAVAAVPLTLLGILSVSQVSSSATDSSNLTWRVATWEALVDAPVGIGGWLFGGAFGPNIRMPATRDANSLALGGAHSLYIGVIGTLGIVGVIAIGWMFVRFWKYPGQATDRSLRWMPRIAIAATLGYGFTYQLPEWWVLFVVIAVLASLAPGVAPQANVADRSRNRPIKLLISD